VEVIDAGLICMTVDLIQREIALTKNYGIIASEDSDGISTMDQADDEGKAKRLKTCPPEVDNYEESKLEPGEDLKSQIKDEELQQSVPADEDGESTELKLAILASLHPDKSQEVLMDYLLAYNGEIEKVSEALSNASETGVNKKRQHSAMNGYQSSIDKFAATTGDGNRSSKPVAKSLVKKGKTLHLYSPAEIERYTPCSLIHNFLPQALAASLLDEMLAESATYLRNDFQMFERTVTTNHTWRLYLDDPSSVESQQSALQYDG
jgi:hypothetical protein